MTDNEQVVAALVRVLDGLSERMVKYPSDDVQNKAAALLGRPGTEWRYESARVYRVPAGDGKRKHVVALYLTEDDDEHDATVADEVGLGGGAKQVVAAECSCEYDTYLPPPEDRTERSVCAHVLHALTLAELEGISLQRPT